MLRCAGAVWWVACQCGNMGLERMPTGLLAMAGNVLSGGRFMGFARADSGRSLPVASCSRDSFTCSTHKHTAPLYIVMGGTPTAGHDEAWPTSTCDGSGQVGCSLCAGSPDGCFQKHGDPSPCDRVIWPHDHRERWPRHDFTAIIKASAWACCMAVCWRVLQMAELMAVQGTGSLLRNLSCCFC